MHTSKLTYNLKVVKLIFKTRPKERAGFKYEKINVLPTHSALLRVIS